MKRLLTLLAITLFFFGCKSEKQKAKIELNYIHTFPQEIVLIQLSKNFVQQTDTISLTNEKDRRIVVALDRPKYVYIQRREGTDKFYMRPGSHLKITENNNQYDFEGGLAGANAFMQAALKNKKLKEKEWNYDSSFTDFKREVNDYFSYKEKLFSDYTSKKENNYFYQLNLVEDKALKNTVLLSYINKKMSGKKSDSLFFEYVDRSLFNFKGMEKYFDAGHLRSFYSEMGVLFFMKKKYGKETEAIQREKELYVLRGDIISESFPQPLKSILLYNDLKYYPLEYDYTSDSLDLTPPRQMLDRYEPNLKNDVYASLLRSYNKYNKQKITYSKDKIIKNFNLKDRHNQSHKLFSAISNRLILIDVWASWCGPCIQSFPKLKRLARNHSGELDVVSISIDNNFSSFKEALEKYKVPGRRKLYAEGGFISGFAKSLQITFIPRYILTDRNGKIIDGAANISDIETTLESMR